MSENIFLTDEDYELTMRGKHSKRSFDMSKCKWQKAVEEIRGIIPHRIGIERPNDLIQIRKEREQKKGENIRLFECHRIITKHTAEKELPDDFGTISKEKVKKIEDAVDPIFKGTISPDNKLPEEFTAEKEHITTLPELLEDTRKYAKGLRDDIEKREEEINKVEPDLATAIDAIAKELWQAKLFTNIRGLDFVTMHRWDKFKETEFGKDYIVVATNIIKPLLASPVSVIKPDKLSYCDYPPSFHKYDKQGICIFCDKPRPVSVDVEGLADEFIPDDVSPLARQKIKSDLISKFHPHIKTIDMDELHNNSLYWKGYYWDYDQDILGDEPIDSYSIITVDDVVLPQAVRRETAKQFCDEHNKVIDKIKTKYTKPPGTIDIEGLVENLYNELGLIEQLLNSKAMKNQFILRTKSIIQSYIKNAKPCDKEK